MSYSGNNDVLRDVIPDGVQHCHKSIDSERYNRQELRVRDSASRDHAYPTNPLTQIRVFR